MRRERGSLAECAAEAELGSMVDVPGF